MRSPRCQWCNGVFGEGHSLSKNPDGSWRHKKEVKNLEKTGSCGYSNGSGGLCGCQKPEPEKEMPNPEPKEPEYI